MSQTHAELLHSIRGALNSLKLCMSALDLPLDTETRLEFLSDVESAADRLAELTIELEACPQEAVEA
jgi:hypothetical protein